MTLPGFGLPSWGWGTSQSLPLCKGDGRGLWPSSFPGSMGLAWEGGRNSLAGGRDGCGLVWTQSRGWCLRLARPLSGLCLPVHPPHLLQGNKLILSTGAQGQLLFIPSGVGGREPLVGMWSLEGVLASDFGGRCLSLTDHPREPPGPTLPPGTSSSSPVQHR